MENCKNVQPVFLNPDRMEQYAWIVRNLKRGVRTAYNAIRGRYGKDSLAVCKGLWIYLRNRELYLKNYKAQHR